MLGEASHCVAGRADGPMYIEMLPLRVLYNEFPLQQRESDHISWQWVALKLQVLLS